jgi:hypothetical protein
MSFLLALIFSFTTYASLEKLIVKEGNFTYLTPSGTGDVEKLQLGISKTLETGPFPIEIFREPNAFVLRTEYIDFSWQNPMPFFYNMEKLYVQKANISIGSENHSLLAPKLIFQPHEGGEFSMDGFDFACAGHSVEVRIENRITDDCLEHLQGKIRSMNIPTTSNIAMFLKDLPPVAPEVDLPAWDFDMLVNKGDFKIDFRMKYYITAGVYAWGHVQLEDDRKTLAIRLDRVKYGYLAVTGIVFKKLRELNNPNIIVAEPWIRVKVSAH